MNLTVKVSSKYIVLILLDMVLYCSLRYAIYLVAFLASYLIVKNTSDTYWYLVSRVFSPWFFFGSHVVTVSAN